MTYREGLQSQEWGRKRQEILERDNFNCQKCGKSQPQLRGLDKAFGINTIDEFNKKGYNFRTIDSDYKPDVIFSESGYPMVIKYIGDESKPLEVENLRFSRKWSDKTKDFLLVYFYEESFLGQDLTDLNIHHKYYIKGHKPWEYDADALIALCVDCHLKTHEQETIPVYNEMRMKLFDSVTCDKCGGSGHIKEFNYYKNGVCFKCLGEGVLID